MIFRTVYMLLIAILVIASCSEDNSVVIEENEEIFSNGAQFIINDNVIEYNAFAEYCNENGKEYLYVSNNPIHLGSYSFGWENFELNDFLFAMVSDPDLGNFSVGGVVYDEEITGVPDVVQKLQDSNVMFDLVTIDSDKVVGTISGSLLAFDVDGQFQFIPYSVSFVAEILGGSEHCN